MRAVDYTIGLILALMVLLFCVYSHYAVAQEAEVDNEMLQYEAIVQQKPDDAEAHRELGFAYAKNGLLDKAKDEFEKAKKIEYNKGYENGRNDAVRRLEVRIYARYVVLSIAVGLFISAVIVAVLSWSELSETYKSLVKNARVRAFIRSVGVKLSPDLRKRAIEISQSKEKLCDAISRETDSSLKEAASAVLPRLDDLTRQASLLLQLQQNLSDYIKDMDQMKLEITRQECEEKLRNETDAEAKRAVEYQLKQIGNKLVNYSRARAKIRTCDAVLNGIVARIDATSLDLMSLPSLMIKKQEFFERISAELDEEINLTRNAAETIMEESQ